MSADEVSYASLSRAASPDLALSCLVPSCPVLLCFDVLHASDLSSHPVGHLFRSASARLSNGRTAEPRSVRSAAGSARSEPRVAVCSAVKRRQTGLGH